MKFTITGASPSGSEHPEVVRLIEKYCRGLPDGSLVTVPVIAKHVQRSLTYVKSFARYVEPSVRVNHQGAFLYGNPKTVKAYQATHKL